MHGLGFPIKKTQPHEAHMWRVQPFSTGCPGFLYETWCGGDASRDDTQCVNCVPAVDLPSKPAKRAASGNRGDFENIRYHRDLTASYW